MKKRKAPKKRIAVIERRHYYADVTIDNVEYTKFMVHFVDDDDYYYMAGLIAEKLRAPSQFLPQRPPHSNSVQLNVTS